MRTMKKQKATEKRIRLTLDLTPKQFDKLREIEEQTGQSKAEIVRNALRLYTYAAERAFDGDTFQVVGRNKVTKDIVFVELT